MKKLLLLLVTIFAINLNAGFTWSQVMSWKNKTVDPDAQYSIETEGYNVRVYEFTPLTDSGITCILLFTNEKMETNCFPKSKEALRKER